MLRIQKSTKRADINPFALEWSSTTVAMGLRTNSVTAPIRRFGQFAALKIATADASTGRTEIEVLR